MANTAKQNNYLKQYRLSKVLPVWVVYELVNASNYVGHTNNLYHTLARHKNKGRDISDYIIHYFSPDKKKAKEYENVMHDLGHPGRHPRGRGSGG